MSAFAERDTDGTKGSAPAKGLPLARRSCRRLGSGAGWCSGDVWTGPSMAPRRAALTLVAAPPRYGKTTAVRSWYAGHEGAFAWVTLDVGDNDPSRFWRYVATAVDRVRQGLGARALRRLDEPRAGVTDPIDELMNGIASFEEELVLVLDDLQHVTDPDCLESLDDALDRLPEDARLIMLTRIDPEFGLAKKQPGELKAQGILTDQEFAAEKARILGQ